MIVSFHHPSALLLLMVDFKLLGVKHHMQSVAQIVGMIQGVQSVPSLAVHVQIF